MATDVFGATSTQSDPLLDRLRAATNGTYDVVGEMGRGGMAVVYAGVDRKLQRRVAIKVMDPRLSMTHGMAERFLQEARIAARLQHPNIIVVHDVRQSDDIIFFVMSLIDGVAVDALCKQPRPLPIDQVRWILLQAARSLAYAHSEGIVHRDIKPANILLNLKGEVILTDFGIAKALGDTGLTQSGTQVGTPMYMSPEQFSGVPIGPPSDQYALGVTAYQMIAGQPPFSGDLYQLIAAHGAKTPTPLRDLRPECPAFLANAVMRMLEKDAANRWPSLEDLQDVFGANMAIDGGAARRDLASTVRTLRDAAGGNITVGGAPSGPTSGQSSSADGRGTHSGETRRNELAPASMVVTISPPGATIFVSGTLELRATVSMDTGQSLPGANAQWSSSDESVVRVQPNGNVSGIAPGTAVVRASVNGGWSEATIRVEAAPIARLALTAPSVTLRVGDVLRPEVVAVDVNGAVCEGVAMAWISRSPAVADLDSPGVIRAIAPGMAVIDMSIGNVRRSMDVSVLRRPIERVRLGGAPTAMQLGDSSALTIEAFDDLGMSADATPARWASSAPSVIHVDSTGRVLAIAPGSARISASIDNATDSIEMESLEPAAGSIQLTVSDERIELGDELSWSLRVKDIHGASRSSSGVRVWSSAPDVLQVDEDAGKARALRIGEAFLCAGPRGNEQQSEKSTSVRVLVTDVVVARVQLFPSTLELEVGAVSAVNVQGLDGRGVRIMSAAAVWDSDNPDVAVVEGNGVVRAMAPGSCTIRARMTNSGLNVIDATLPVRVRAAAVARLSIAAERTMLEAGESMQLRVTTFDAMDVEVRDAVPLWRSMQPHVAQVDPAGQLVALAPGRATIIAELDGKSGQVAILVAPAAVVSLTLTVPSGDVVVGKPVRIGVAARDRNGQDVSPPMQWMVEPADAATITSLGELTARRAGEIHVRASLAAPADATGLLSARSALESSVSLSARAPRITSMSFASPALTMRAGRSLRPDLRTVTDLGETVPASAVHWSSQDPAIAQVDGTGELRAVGIGETVVTASSGDLRATLTVRVEAAAALPRAKPLALAGAGVAVAALAWALWPGSSPSAPPTTDAPQASQETVAAGAAVQPPSTTPLAEGPATPPPARPDSVPARPSSVPITEPANVSPARTPAVRPPAAPAPVVASRNDARQVPPASTAQASRQQERAVVAKAVAESIAATTRSAAPATVPAYAPPTASVASPPVNEPPTRPSASPSANTEAPSASELRAIADRIAADVRSGKLRPSADLKQFFADGAEHKVTVGSSPGAPTSDQGQLRTQFDLSLTRFNAGGALERRSTQVRIGVAKRDGAVELLSTTFGPVVKPGSK